MAKPWEKYQPQEEPKPWEKHSSPDSEEQTPIDALLSAAKARTLGLVEPVMSMGSGMAGQAVGGLVGIGQTLNPLAEEGAGANAVKQVQDWMTYRPRSEAGQRVMSGIQEEIAEPLSELMEPLRKGDEALEAGWHPAAATALEMAPEIAASAFGLKGFGAKNTLPKPKIVTDPIKKTIMEAKNAGYKMPPSHVKPTVSNRLIEGVAGKAQTQQSAAFKNQQITNDLARKSIGLNKGEPITHEALKRVRDKAVKAYKDIAKSGEVKVDDKYLTDLQRLSKDIDTLAKDFPDANLGANVDISKLIDTLLKDSFDAKGGLEYVKQLRKNASANFSGIYDPTKQALAVTQRQAADVLENMLARHMESLGNTGAKKAFNNARIAIAKTYTIDSALNEATGNVIATNLGTQLRKGKPLSGDLELIGKFSRAFPKAAKEVTDSPGVSAVDSFVAGAGAFGTASGVPVASPMMAWPAARIGAREGILSKPFQNKLMPNDVKIPLRNKNMALIGAMQSLNNDKNNGNY